MSRIGLFTVPVLTLVAAISPAGATPTYELIDLGALSSSGETAAVSINEVGSIAGFGTDAGGQQHAIRWDANGASMTVLTGPLVNGATQTVAAGINASGTIAGTGFGTVNSVFVWRTDGSLQSMPSLAALGYLNADATGINCIS